MAWKPKFDPFQIYTSETPKKQNEIIFGVLIAVLVGTGLYILSFYIH